MFECARGDVRYRAPLCPLTRSSLLVSVRRCRRANDVVRLSVMRRFLCTRLDVTAAETRPSQLTTVFAIDCRRSLRYSKPKQCAETTRVGHHCKPAGLDDAGRRETRRPGG
ncbi:hypothetical protein LSAT2_017082 [Lamellibrachia satsuma]|nr:hypothetical protein LSAT2_017082 [Lamellibrachia satsuma]